MGFSRFLFALLVVSGLSFPGCGGGKEPTSVGGSELESYVEENAAALAEEDAILDAEDEEDDADDE